MTTDTEKTKPNIPLNPNDIGTLMDSAPIYISGTTCELIRDAYNQPVPWLHNAHAKPDDDKVIFLVGRGWSATRKRLEYLDKAGIPWMAINNYPEDGPKPRYWCTGDPPGYFGNRIWDDPDVMKFVPITSANGIRPRLDAYDHAKTPKDAPNVHFFNSCYDDPTYDNWLHTPWINWGTSMFGENTPKEWFAKGAARSSMFIGLRLCWHLGYRTVCLLGCDCTPGHHPAPMYWPTILYLAEQLKPTFDRYCYRVIQTNPDSHLRSFPIRNFDDLMRQAPQPLVPLSATPFVPDLLEVSR